ncbi:glucans biosynthesis glucosyltransferase MdoH [Swingsia samuiensis]|uniref:Glucans biosynthesis glucosyltransferase H n=1 Tax=Swingsia samuiensis TaxID=1293412 RepID=A0A4Y6UK30_9PROT|nr:glucans biosynthesis glucosyltransferase MdoH [Swingsia samuiensis]QDH16998.1 glucans biosynthesis glucosyltransferase MdoH [Swingsia samuiensis]
MTDFRAYLKAAGLSEAEAHEQNRNLDSWEDFFHWMDHHTQDEELPSAKRTSIGAPQLDLCWKAALFRRFHAMRDQGLPVGSPPSWTDVIEKRRHISLCVTLSLTAILSWISASTLSSEHISLTLSAIYTALYTVMIFFIISTFSKLILGTWHALRGPNANPWHPSHSARDPLPDSKVAVLFPVYHEDPARVSAGIISVAKSLERHAPEHIKNYEFFFLSDSRQANYRIAELAALIQVRKACPNFSIHYRWRKSNDHAKLGNVTDFCRRWGSRFKYMLVMDADSLMNGATIQKLFRMMEGNHRLGILQTSPTPVLRESLFGRMQQFAGRLYGTAFSYSMQAMNMGHASYIGHNALIRIQPFVDHCLLPELSGTSPWGGKPLSHDIIEAAFMARAGYEVWLLPELEGSYEEIPSNLLSFLIRERRWMQGNLQHIRLLFIEGIRPVHRETFITGVMAYVSAPLWAIFLIVSAWYMTFYIQTFQFSLDMMGSLSLPSIMMLASTIVFLFAPRVFAILQNLPHAKSQRFGGKIKMIASTLAETLFSFFFAPIMMAFLTRFTWLWIKRRSISWGNQQRDDDALPWKMCLKHFGWTSSLGILITGYLIYKLYMIPTQAILMFHLMNGHFALPNSILFWFFPILSGLIFSVFIARLTSFSFPALLKAKWFMIPEEHEVPLEITQMLEWDEKVRSTIPDPENLEHCIQYALNSPDFYVAQRARARHISRFYSNVSEKMTLNKKLTIDEFMTALSEKKALDEILRLYNYKQS